MSVCGGDLIPFLMEMVVEIPRKAAWSYLIRPARDESATSIPQFCSKDEEENRRVQMSPQSATSAARIVAWTIGHSSIVEQYVVASTVCARISIPNAP